MAAVVTAVAAALSAMAVEAFPNLAVLLVCYVLVGWATVLVGLVAWDRRPSNRTGLLLVVEGLATMASSAGNVRNPALVVAGTVFAQAQIGALLHLLLAFPSGRLGSRLRRALVVAGYLVTVGLQFILVVLEYKPGFDPTTPATRGPAAHAVSVGQQALAAVVIVVTAVVLVRQLLAAPRLGPARRTIVAVYGYGTGTILFLTVSAQVLQPVFGWSILVLFAVQLAVFLAVPFVFAAGILRGFGRTTEIEELGAWLGAADTTRTTLREALAQSLGDPSLQLLFPRTSPSESGGAVGGTAAGLIADLVTPDGRPARRPERGLGRASVDITALAGEGIAGQRLSEQGIAEPIATIVYDPTLIADPDWVHSAGRVVSLALERERLTAQLIASREQVRQSRARLVEVADLERRRFAADLHDLLQSRLVLAALHAGTLASQTNPDDVSRQAAAALGTELDAAITELRHLVHGVLPAVLQERGLFAAAAELVDRIPLPVDLHLDGDARDLPPTVASSGYFILAEALSNAVKHSRATMITVSLTRAPDLLHLDVHDDGGGDASTVATPSTTTGLGSGMGLRGIADRVDALDGTFTLTSPPGQGTRLEIRLPCGP